MIIFKGDNLEGQGVFYQWPIQLGRIVGGHGPGKNHSEESTPHPIEGDYLGSESMLRVAHGRTIFKGQGNI